MYPWSDPADETAGIVIYSRKTIGNIMQPDLALLLLGELLSDANFLLKIFALMTIVSFILNHLGKGPMALLLIAIISWFVVFDYWRFFGGIFILYLMLTFGMTQFLIDIFWALPQSGDQAHGGMPMMGPMRHDGGRR